VAPPPGYETAAGGDVLLRSADRAWLEPLGLADLERAFAHRAEARSRYKALARLADPAGRPVFVKRYDYDRREVWLRAAAKWNFPVFSGPRELENLLALAAAGLRVPVPLAAGERDAGPRRRSFVALAELPGEPVDAPPAAPADRRARARALADLVARLHGAGFWHKDLYLENVRVDPEAGLGLLDCERVARRPGGPPPRWRIKDLAALDYSAAAWSAADRLRFLRAYLGVPRLGLEARRLARVVRRKADRLARRGAKGP